MSAKAVRYRDLVGDQIRRIRDDRYRVDLQFDAFHARNMQPVDVERAGMPLLGRLVERRLNQEKFGSECVFGYRVLIVDDKAQRIVATSAVDRLLSEIEAAAGREQSRALLEDEEV